jgi:PleD family two-component response regulator
MLLGCGIDPSIGGDMAGKMKILIVEDPVEIRGLMARFLERAGYEVIEAETGLTAIDRANSTHPDLITIDLGLPDITGDEVVARLKADPATKHIPVIVITAYYGGAPLVVSCDRGRRLRSFVQAYTAPNSRGHAPPILALASTTNEASERHII